MSSQDDLHIFSLTTTKAQSGLRVKNRVPAKLMKSTGTDISTLSQSITTSFLLKKTPFLLNQLSMIFGNSISGSTYRTVFNTCPVDQNSKYSLTDQASPIVTNLHQFAPNAASTDDMQHVLINSPCKSTITPQSSQPKQKDVSCPTRPHKGKPQAVIHTSAAPTPRSPKPSPLQQNPTQAPRQNGKFASPRAPEPRN